MKRIFLALLTALFILGITGSGRCQSPMEKLGRGLANVVTSPFEFPKNIVARYCSENSPYDAVFLGAPKGIMMTVVRCVTGIYDIVTFPLPAPSGYKPVLEPEFAWEE
jgi:putative exosortase-associated protein (TIGR04073 family)